jgi:phosphoribosylformylglycinamidine cyclo-ligase|tara:strand:+ start:481 stop:1449 length:969 start_codon:yes stop_codon:yes gene_type:complete
LSTRYKEVGVDIEAGNAFVDQLKQKAPAIGGFGGMFKVPTGYEKPILVSGADGVGTKINISRLAGDYSTIGIDLVAMCVNDVICCGAKPLYFLDYISTQKIDDRLDKIMEGIIKGCEIAGIELIGGETAEHGRFAKDIDLAGFCTGIVEEDKIIDGSRIKPGDKIIGIESSGLHSNGYSLINDMLLSSKIWCVTDELMAPTRIYAKEIAKLLEPKFVHKHPNFLTREEIPILGMAHITGGGLEENLSRCLPKGLTLDIDWNSWTIPPIFNKVREVGEVQDEDMRKIFNMGIGYCVVVPPEAVDDVMLLIDYPSQVIGEVCQT